jgi:hypothetical protein
VSVPYEFHSAGNRTGSKLKDWLFDVELYPWPWMRLESDWTIEGGNFYPELRDSRTRLLNLDLVVVGGRGEPDAQHAHELAPVAPGYRAFESGAQTAIPLLPQGQWYLGLGHRYAQNDKTESVLELDWRLSEKWQVGTFHRFTWKEVALAAGGGKRFNHLRERQYTLSRDLHDWTAELIYRVDRDFGEELFFTLTLKAYPDMPIEAGTSYHQPKEGSQTSPFFPGQYRRPSL